LHVGGSGPFYIFFLRAEQAVKELLQGLRSSTSCSVEWQS